MQQNQKLYEAPHKFSHGNLAVDCAHEYIILVQVLKEFAANISTSY